MKTDEYGDNSPEALLKSGADYLADRFFRHLGIGHNPIYMHKKLAFLSYLVNSELHLMAGLKMPTARKSFGFRRLVLVREVMQMTFTPAFSDYMDAVIKEIQFDIPFALSCSLKYYFENNPTITIQMRRPRSTRDAVKMAYSNTGILQRMETLNPRIALSYLRRVNNKVSKHSGSSERRKNQSGAGLICMIESPNGDKAGLVKALALLATVSTGCRTEHIMPILRPLRRCLWLPMRTSYSSRWPYGPCFVDGKFKIPDDIVVGGIGGIGGENKSGGSGDTRDADMEEDAHYLREESDATTRLSSRLAAFTSNTTTTTTTTTTTKILQTQVLLPSSNGKDEKNEQLLLLSNDTASFSNGLEAINNANTDAMPAMDAIDAASANIAPLAKPKILVLPKPIVHTSLTPPINPSGVTGGVTTYSYKVIFDGSWEGDAHPDWIPGMYEWIRSFKLDHKQPMSIRQMSVVWDKKERELRIQTDAGNSRRTSSPLLPPPLDPPFLSPSMG